MNSKEESQLQLDTDDDDGDSGISGGDVGEEEE